MGLIAKANLANFCNTVNLAQKKRARHWHNGAMVMFQVSLMAHCTGCDGTVYLMGRASVRNDALDRTLSEGQYPIE